MEKFTMKRPQKADYVNKYGFQGERIWRFELLKYEEAKQAFDRRQANIKAYQEKIKKEQKAIRDYKRTKELYPDVYEAGGESAIKHLAKINDAPTYTDLHMTIPQMRVVKSIWYNRMIDTFMKQELNRQLKEEKGKKKSA